MGWTEVTARPEIHNIFTGLGRKYTLQWVSAPYPQVRLRYQRLDIEDLGIEISTISEITKLFPDFVYVEFTLVTYSESDPGDLFEFKTPGYKG